VRPSEKARKSFPSFRCGLIRALAPC
jgi:hypothetical protein